MLFYLHKCAYVTARRFQDMPRPNYRKTLALVFLSTQFMLSVWEIGPKGRSLIMGKGGGLHKKCVGGGGEGKRFSHVEAGAQVSAILKGGTWGSIL